MNDAKNALTEVKDLFRGKTPGQFLRNEFLGSPADIAARNPHIPVDRIWRAVLAEFFGTMIFVFYATGGVVIALMVDPAAGALAILIVAFAQGFALMVAIFGVGNVSGGHVNPAITITLMAVRRIGFLVGLMFIGGQIGGAIIASLFLKAITPGPFQGALGSTTLGPGYGKGRGLLLEVILTFTLAFVVFAAVVDKVGFRRVAPIAIGLVVFLDLIIGFKFTGGSMNPARSLGPAIVSGTWGAHWIYWLGPILGALFAGFLWDFLFLPRPQLLPKTIRRDEPVITLPQA